MLLLDKHCVERLCEKALGVVRMAVRHKVSCCIGEEVMTLTDRCQTVNRDYLYMYSTREIMNTWR